jgi:hypothetical protein
MVFMFQLNIYYTSVEKLEFQYYITNNYITSKAKKKICVFTVTRPALIFASDPINFYTEFG